MATGWNILFMPDCLICNCEFLVVLTSYNICLGLFLLVKMKKKIFLKELRNLLKQLRKGEERDKVIMVKTYS